MSHDSQSPEVESRNFVATAGFEHTNSQESDFADIVPLDFVSAVAHLGPEHLVEAMNEAVKATALGNSSNNTTQHQSRSQNHHSYQQQQQQQQQHFSPIYFPSPLQQQQMHRVAPLHNNAATTTPVQHHAPAAPGYYVPVHDVGSRSSSAVSTQSTALLPTPMNEAATTASPTPLAQSVAAAAAAVSSPPVVSTQLKRVHRRREELRSSAFVEGQESAIVAVPPRAPNRTNNYPATPAYWANRGSGGGSGGASDENETWQAQTMKRRGLTTPAVPRPDLPDDEDEEMEKVRLRRLGLRSPSEIAAAEAAKRYESSEEALRRADLKRRATALSEHYRREFSSSCNVAGAKKKKKNGDRRGAASGDGLVNSDNEQANEDHDSNTDEDVPPRPGAVLRPPVPSEPLTPSERVFKSRAVRMAASDHKILAASPEAVAVFSHTPRVRSPFSGLLSATEVDHFRTAPPPPPAVSLRATEAIDRALKEGSLDLAHRSLNRVDRKLHPTTVQNASHSSSTNLRADPQHFTTPSRRYPGLVIGAGPVSVPLMDNQHNAYHHSNSGIDDLSSPQATAMLERLLRQKAEAQHDASSAALDPTNRRAFLSAH